MMLGYQAQDESKELIKKLPELLSKVERKWYGEGSGVLLHQGKMYGFFDPDKEHN